MICTEIEAQTGKITGRYLGRDCTGEEKAKRIRKKYDLNKYPIVYAYGDTKDDIAMLSLATKKYYRWQEVTDADLAANLMNTGRSDPDNAERLKYIGQENIWLSRLIEEQD